MIFSFCYDGYYILVNKAFILKLMVQQSLVLEIIFFIEENLSGWGYVAIFFIIIRVESSFLHQMKNSVITNHSLF